MLRYVPFNNHTYTMLIFLRSSFLKTSNTDKMAAAFRAALTRIGIDAATRAAINENGFNTVQDKDLNKLPKHLEAWKHPRAPANNQVRIPFVSLTKLKATHYWVLAQRSIGVDATNVADVTVAVIT